MRTAIVFFWACALAAAGETGHVQVQAPADCKVFLDDQFRGVTTAGEKGLVLLDVAVGKHQVRVVAPEGTAVAKDVSVERGAIVTVALDQAHTAPAAAPDTSPVRPASGDEDRGDSAPVVAAKPDRPRTPAFWRSDARGLIGFKALDKDDWEPVEDQGLLGVEYFGGPRTWPVAVALGLAVSGWTETDYVYPGGGPEYDVTGSTSEFTLGVVAIGGTRIFEGFGGGGLALVGASKEETNLYTDVTEDDSGTGVGVFLEGGFQFVIGRHFLIGAEARFTWASEVTLFDKDVQPGGLTVALTLGGRF